MTVLFVCWILMNTVSVFLVPGLPLCRHGAQALRRSGAADRNIYSEEKLRGNHCFNLFYRHVIVLIFSRSSRDSEYGADTWRRDPGVTPTWLRRGDKLTCLTVLLNCIIGYKWEDLTWSTSYCYLYYNVGTKSHFILYDNLVQDIEYVKPNGTAWVNL